MTLPAITAEFDAMQAEVLLRKKAIELGFERFGIARIKKLPAMTHYSNWLAKGYHAEMEYLVRHAEKKDDPGLIVANAKSIIVCAANYNTAAPKSTDPAGKTNGWISRYAWGDDYHEVLQKKIAALNTYWQSLCQNKFSGRYYVDTGPVFERAWAEQAGIGWSGKNCCIINRELRSYLLLAVIITDAHFEVGTEK